MVRISHKVKRCTNGDAVKRLANAFDKCANVDFGGPAEQLGRGHRGGDHREVERFTNKAYTTMKRSLTRFTQERATSTKQGITRSPYGYSHAMPTQLLRNILKGVCK
jgi:hypothetical protein